MIGIDANILLYAYASNAPEHPAAHAFLVELGTCEDIAVSEFTLAEFTLLLRNPAVLVAPLTAAAAAKVIDRYRRHPSWRIPGFPPNSRDVHEQLWKIARKPQFPGRRLYDVRTALSLIAFGVTEFATANLKEFQGLGFQRVWSPVH